MLKTNIFVGPPDGFESRPSPDRLAALKRASPEQWVRTPYFWLNGVPVKFLIEQATDNPLGKDLRVWSSRPRAEYERDRPFKQMSGLDYGLEPLFYDARASDHFVGIRVMSLVHPESFNVKADRFGSELLAVRAVVVAQTVTVASVEQQTATLAA